MTTTIEKIQKLRARTTSRGATEAEMDAAARSIGRLLMESPDLSVTDGQPDRQTISEGETVAFEGVKAIAETRKGILLDIDGNGPTDCGRYWMPKSQLGDGNEVCSKGDVGQLVITKWIARAKGLVA